MKTGLFLLLLFTVCGAFAQSNYHKGFVTDNDGHNLQGYINYREWDENPKFILFKTSLNDIKPQTFYPSAIKWFSVDGFERYYSYRGRISLNRTKFPDLPISRDTSSKTDVAFLKLLTTGDNLSLYSYTDSIKTRYFIQDKHQQPVELLYQQYYDATQSNTLLSNEYFAVINALAVEYAPADTKFFDRSQKTSYKRADLEYFVNYLNGNRAIKTNKVSGTRFFAGAAVNISQTGFDDKSAFSTISKLTTYTPKITAGVDIFSNPNVQRIIFRADVAFSYIKVNGSGTHTDLNFDLSPSAYSFNQYTGTLTPQIIWNIYNKDAFKFYIGAGVAFNVSTYSNKSFIAYSKYQKPDDYNYKLEAAWSAFPVQAGIVLNKRLEIFVTDLLAPSSLYSGEDANIYVHSYNIGLHYLFRKSHQ